MNLHGDIVERSWNSEKSMKHLNREFLPHEQTPEEGINSSQGNKNKNYVMRVLHQIKLMTRNGFGIELILVERIKRDIAQT